MEIRRSTPADAAGLSACFRRCYGEAYGEAYGDALFYDEQALSSVIEAGTLRSVLAVNAAGDIVGHTGLRHRHPGAQAAEAGSTVVDPRYQGHGLLWQLEDALQRLCKDEGFIGYVHYPTTADEVMQRRSVEHGGVELGIMLAYVPDHIPAEADDPNVNQDAATEQAPQAATIVYQPCAASPPQRVCVPEPYRRLAEHLYQDAGLPRDLLAPAEVPGGESAGWQHHFQPRRNLLQMFVTRCRHDMVAAVEDLLDRHNPALAHVDLCLSDTHSSEVVPALRRLGFVFCGLLPYYARSDVLRLQRLDDIERCFEPDLANEAARALLKVIHSDSRAARALH